MNRQNSSKNGSIKMVDCIIIGGADMNTECVDRSSFDEKYIICADRGVAHAQKIGVKPDLIVGDFDSLGFVPQTDCRIMQFKPEKDDTDLMIALKEAIKLGFKDILIYAALGGRLDHTFASIQTLAYALEHGAKAQLVSESDIAELFIPGEYSIKCKERYSMSLFSYSEKVTGLTIKGAKYEVTDVDLDCSFPLGVSNEIIGSEAAISFEGGRLLVIQSLLQ